MTISHLINYAPVILSEMEELALVSVELQLPLFSPLKQLLGYRLHNSDTANYVDYIFHQLVLSTNSTYLVPILILVLSLGSVAATSCCGCY